MTAAEDLEPCSSSCPPQNSVYFPPSPSSMCDPTDQHYDYKDDLATEYAKSYTPVSIIHRNYPPSPPPSDSSSLGDNNEDFNEDIYETPDHDEAALILPPKPVTEAGTSTLGAIFLIVNAALGAGLLNLPKAFDQAGGVATAVTVQALLLVFIMLALLILAQTANINKSTTLQEVIVTFQHLDSHPSFAGDAHGCWCLGQEGHLGDCHHLLLWYLRYLPHHHRGPVRQGLRLLGW